MKSNFELYLSEKKQYNRMTILRVFLLGIFFGAFMTAIIVILLGISLK